VTPYREPTRKPGRHYQTALIAYLAALAAAEVAVTFGNPVLVFPLHGGLLVMAAVYLAFSRGRNEAGSQDRGFDILLLVLSLGPLIRIISLTLPLAQLEPPFRYVSAGIPLALGGVLAARAARFRAAQLGIAWRWPGWQVLVVLASLGLGFVEFVILRPTPLGPLPWVPSAIAPALAVGIATGFPEELIFRGVMQTAVRPFLGRWNWVYVSGIFAVLHIGYQSYLDLVFVFGVGLFYGWIFERTRSIVGVSIGHGLANVVLFYVAPNVLSPAAVAAVTPEAMGVMAAGATVALVIGGLLYWRSGPAVPFRQAGPYRAA
jgi:membrane protease YdiL (CAAX protease family)